MPSKHSETVSVVQMTVINRVVVRRTPTRTTKVRSSSGVCRKWGSFDRARSTVSSRTSPRRTMAATSTQPTSTYFLPHIEALQAPNKCSTFYLRGAHHLQAPHFNPTFFRCFWVSIYLFIYCFTDTKTSHKIGNWRRTSNKTSASKCWRVVINIPHTNIHCSCNVWQASE